MNKVHKINGFVYVTSDDEIKEGDWYLKNSVPTKRIHLGNNIYREDKKIILTNNHILTSIQQLTPQEVYYLNSVDECDVEEKLSRNDYQKVYELQLPKQETIEEMALKLFPDKSYWIGSGKSARLYDPNYRDREVFIQGYNHALKTLYTDEEVQNLLYKLSGYIGYEYDIQIDGSILDKFFNQNKKK